MGILDSIKRLYAAPEPAKPVSISPKVSGTRRDLFGVRKKDYGENRRIYEQGGVVAEAIDCHPLFMFTNGVRWEGADEGLVKEIQDRHAAFDFEDLAFKLVCDSLVVDKGIGEILPARGGGDPVASVDYRKAEEFEPVYDDFGELVEYKQTVDTAGYMAPRTIPKDKMFYLDLGLPLVTRCKDDIVRDTEIADGTSKAIYRHGYPRYVVEVGQLGESIPDTVIDSVSSKFEALKPDHEFVTPAGVKVSNIDSMGLTNAKMYNDFSIQRLCAAMGTPEEMLGLGRGSTEATANVRLQAWYDRIGTLQRRFASQWNKQIVDLMLKGMGRKEGDVKLAFNDVSPSDDLQIAQFIATVAQASPLDPIMTKNEMRQRLGLKPVEGGDDTPEYEPPMNPFDGFGDDAVRDDDERER